MNQGSDLLFRLHTLSKTYAGRKVLDIHALDVYQGEILALVGPSGAGKSTLLRIMNFLEAPTTGSIQYNGAHFRPGEAVPLPVRRRVTMVFQRPVLLDRTIWENVAYGLRLRGEKVRPERIQAALEEVGLASLARQRARTLSGGEAQRVALARALVLEPQVLLLDEPTANLDPQNIAIIERIVLRMNREHGTTLILVTHNIFQARRLARRVAFILDGKLVEVANVDAFFNQPDDPRSAAFVQGDMVY